MESRKLIKGEVNDMIMLELDYKIVGNGKTVLVIETGIGGAFYNYYSLVECIKEDFTVIMYHRAGYGKSQCSSLLRTTRNIAKELNHLLNKIGIKDGFILMGHSFGGLCVQQYAMQYTNKLKGIILIDSTSYNLQKLFELDVPTMKSYINIDKRVESNLNLSKKSKEELKVENKDTILSYMATVNNKEKHNIEDFFTSTTLYRTIADEFEHWTIDANDIKNHLTVLDIPLTVIARDNKIAEEYWIEYGIPKHEAVLYEKEWRQLQVELTQLSNRGKLIIADHSGHAVYLDKPDIIIHTLKTLL